MPVVKTSPPQQTLVKTDMRSSPSAPGANRSTAVKTVLVLLAVGVTLSFAGYQYREQQRSKQITWQTVNNTLQEVEIAKQDLFRTLSDKAGS